MRALAFIREERRRGRERDLWQIRSAIIEEFQAKNGKGWWRG